MKIETDRSRLIDGLKMALPGANAKDAIRIYGNVKIEAGNGKIALTTTNGMITIYSEVECTVHEGGETTVPMQKMYQIISNLTDGMVTFEDDGKRATIRGGASRFNLPCIPATEFPKLPDTKDDVSYRIKASELQKMLKKTSYAQSLDNTRRTLAGVLYEVTSSNLRCVATDGRRLALVEIDKVEGDENGVGRYIIPTASVSVIQKFLDSDCDVEILSRNTQLAFIIEGGKYRVYTKLVDGEYPNYGQVIPQNSDTKVVVDREMFLDTIKRVSIMASSDSGAVKFSVTNGLITMEAKGDEYGDAHDEVTAKYYGNNIDILLNPKYVIDALSVCVADEIELSITSGCKPVVLKSPTEKFMCVLMPLRTA